MSTNIIDHQQAMWSACDKENQQLKAENERLSQQLADIQGKQKIALDNAYANGYTAIQAEMLKEQP
jgi:hypothetical protein